MAGQSRRTNPSVSETLFAEGYRFEFFQAVRLLERIYPQRQPVGKDAEPSEEAVRFRTRASLTYPPSDIYEITENGEAPPEMTVAFMGLTGLAGVLPRHYTELLIDRLRMKDQALGEFLDLFNHRLISFFFRAWQKHRFHTAHNRALPQYLLSLMGLGTAGLENRLEVADRVLLFYTGLLARRPHSVSAIESVLGDYFQAPISIVQFVGQWLGLEETNCSRMGAEEASAGLGQDTVAGSRVWDQQSKFRIRVGPLSYARFYAFLPPGSGYGALKQLTRLLAGPEFDVEVQLILRAEEAPLSAFAERGQKSSMLGWNTWISSAAPRQDLDDVVLPLSGD